MGLFNRKVNKPIRHLVGENAEKSAYLYLKQAGLKLLEKNFHSRFGEIDLIMHDGDTLVFIEVRCRKLNAQVSAEESITATKIRKIRKTAEYYLQKFDRLPACRFDVIAMIHNDKDCDYNIEWIKDAF